jgi:hypothetical protein
MLATVPLIDVVAFKWLVKNMKIHQVRIATSVSSVWPRAIYSKFAGRDSMLALRENIHIW